MASFISHFIPDWVKADRIIRKELKEKTEKPLVPLSSFDPLARPVASTPTSSLSSLSPSSSLLSTELMMEASPSTKKEEEIVKRKEPSRRLIQVIGEEEPEEKMEEKVEGEKKECIEEVLECSSQPLSSSSLLLLQPSSTPPSSSSSSSETPTISKHPESLAEMIQRRSQGMRISHEEDETHCKLTTEEKDLLLSIKNVTVTVHPNRMHTALFSLVDILCAYCYDVRMTQHDPTPESAWTLSILSPTLSWLVPSASLRNTLVGFVRRVLIYPYLRRYDLARLCIKDCMVILKLGKRRLLKCLLEVGSEFYID